MQNHSQSQILRKSDASDQWLNIKHYLINEKCEMYLKEDYHIDFE